MQLASTGRFVFVAQWIAAVVLPVWIVFGRVLIGTGLGWFTLIGIVIAPVLVLVLLVPPIVALFDSEARRARSARTSYVVATFIAWGALFLAGFAISDGGDDVLYLSAFSRWFGLSDEASTAVFVVLLLLALVGCVLALVAAVAGIVRSRRAVRG